MTEAKIYSERLGAIRDDQFAAAAARFGLGTFVSAAPTTAGLFGQNAFVTTSGGEYVLRGAPHWVNDGRGGWQREDRWQFTKEGFFARELHRNTQTPVPWPYLHDESPDIFGWPYVLMPRMPGHCFNEREILTLDAGDRRGVAEALGAMLAEMQKLTWPFAGDFDTHTIELTPYPDGNTQFVIEETRRNTLSAGINGVVSAEDVDWIDDAVQAAHAAPEPPCTYVHCDYKLNNVTVSHDTNQWRVTGLFDLHEARFGDGVLDIVRQTCSYLDTEPDLARVFVENYFRYKPASRGVTSLMPLYVINDRMKFWAFFTKPDARAAWTRGRSFRGWAERYVDEVLKLL